MKRYELAVWFVDGKDEVYTIHSDCEMDAIENMFLFSGFVTVSGVTGETVFIQKTQIKQMFFRCVGE